MRIFVSDVRRELAAGADESELVREVLAYAVKKHWGCAMPAIEKDGRGKPCFEGVENMHFSLSHTKTHVLVAVSDSPVGADIETVRETKKAFERLFSPRMLSDFGYFGGWTLREAVFKLRGEGKLREMDFRLEGGEIVAPFEGIHCRGYEYEGCAIAAASWKNCFPEIIEKVEPEIFCSERA